MSYLKTAEKQKNATDNSTPKILFGVHLATIGKLSRQTVKEIPNEAIQMFSYYHQYVHYFNETNSLIPNNNTIFILSPNNLWQY